MAVAIRDVIETQANEATQQVPQLAYKSLISEELWRRLTNRIVKDEKVDPAMAERIMDQALGFLVLCATKKGKQSYSPSETVDTGWHTFILYTFEYAQFCQQVAGRFIHHSPSDKVGVSYGTGNIARTVEAMKAAGIVVDEELWKGHKLGCACRVCDEGGAVNSGPDYCTGDSCSGHQCDDTRA